MRNAGTMNIENPVAMPNGGITIFLIETAVRPSRTRQVKTATRPTSEPMTDIPLGRNII
jgi:hypothetical protein